MFALSARAHVLNIRDQKNLEDLKERIQARAESLQSNRQRNDQLEWSQWLEKEIIVLLGEERGCMMLNAHENFGGELGPYVQQISLEYAMRFADVFAEGNRMMAEHGRSVMFKWTQGAAPLQPSASAEPCEKDKTAINQLWQSVSSESDDDHGADSDSAGSLNGLEWAQQLFCGGDFGSGSTSRLNLPLVSMAALVLRDPRRRACPANHEHHDDFVKDDLSWEVLCEDHTEVS